MNITEFLEARIAEDEAAAKAYAKVPPLQVFNGSTWIGGYDPARVLAECAAKRAIIKMHDDWPVLVERGPSFDAPDPTDVRGMVYRATQQIAWMTQREYVKRFGTEPPTTRMVKALAAVYADHPDYQEEWA